MTTSTAVVTLLVAVASDALGQARAIPLPDTAGANFAVADSARGLGTPEDYDAMLGVWHFRFQARNADGTFAEPFTGHWTFRKRGGDRPIIEDHWRADNPNRPFDAGTVTYRAYNPKRKVWEMHGSSTNNAESWQPGLSWSGDGSRYVIQHVGGGALMRFRYFAIEPNRFLWRADVTTDQGKSWKLDWWTMEVTRVGR